MDEDTILGADEAHDEIDVEGLDEVRHAVRLVDVSRTYMLGKSKIDAVRGVNLEVGMGDYIVISGHSGSGKTTLLNIIGAIDSVTEGRIHVMDVPIEDYDESFRATFRLQNTGYMFQSYNLISTLTAIENVMFPMQLTPKPISDLSADARNLLEMVDMNDRLDHLPWQLSSGEQQRVALARAMANDPPIILADEPTANLDEASAEMVRTILHNLNNNGKAVIVMTHDETISSVSGVRRFRMSKGELLSDV
ncbi:MAG: ABC transporter ATP-binding protein [Candidatus Thorarchaeota archaeon]